MAPLTRRILQIEGDPDLSRDMMRLYGQQATEVTIVDVQLDPIPAVRLGRRHAKPGIGAIYDGDYLVRAWRPVRIAHVALHRLPMVDGVFRTDRPDHPQRQTHHHNPHAHRTAPLLLARSKTV